MGASHITTGRRGELAAQSFLIKKGYIIKEKNYRSACGEIDIIAMDGNTIVFVEVKSRKSCRYGLPQESVTHAKQDKIKKAALSYLQYNKKLDLLCRFDVIAVLFSPTADKAEITHIESAF